MLSHGAIAAASMGLLAVLNVSDQSRALHAAPMFHLADGALGIGVLVGYAPGTHPDEYVRVAALAGADAHVAVDGNGADVAEGRRIGRALETTGVAAIEIGRAHV